MRKISFLMAALVFAALLTGISPAAAAQLTALLPLNRTAYQTNELIDISVVRSDTQALPAGMLTMVVTGADNSKMTFAFPVQAVPVVDGQARTTEHLHLNGWLLRPGAYLVEIAADGATLAKPVTLNIYSHIRKSNYRTVHWGGPNGNMMATEGEDGMGFNLIMTGGTNDQEASIRDGVDVMGNCLMGGGHQHDLKMANDWSDPYVYLGAVQRGVDRAFSFRTLPNAIGAHLHDEPGLTWAVHPHLKVMTDHDIQQQRDAYKRAYGEEAIWFDELDTKDPVKLAQWERLNDFKLGFMDAFWKSAKDALSRLKPDYLAVTQSQYGWSALFDGYYFNVVRSMPIVSGHGGYNDFGLRNLNATWFLEMSLPRQLDKPTWYLPEWYNMTPDAFRLEHNMSFITGIQGMSTPPGLGITSEAAPGIIECNKLFTRLGTIFAKPEYTNQDLTMLYSKSNYYVNNKALPQMGDFTAIYMAAKMTQYPMQVVLDEDIIDGSLAANHKAIVVAGVSYLDPAVIAGLENFAANGGLVLTTADTTVAIKGATKLDIVPDALMKKAAADADLITDANQKKAAGAKANSFRAQIEYAEPLAKMLKAALLNKGIRPAFESDLATIAAGKQVRGEIEYLFAVNYTPEAGYSELAGGYGVPVSAKATISLQDDGRTSYNAITGGMTALTKDGQTLKGTLQFGPGQMIAIARTARPIGGVQVGLPVINRDFTRETDPLRVEFSAMLVDAQKNVLAGTAPMEVKVSDPLGVVRYDLYRATDKGILTMSLPLAANDPAGAWTVTVKELLNNSQGVANFTYQPAAQCGVLAGKTHRAVFFPDDKPNFYKFFRNYRTVTIVTGASPYNAAAAERLATALGPYNIRSFIITAADANKPRELTPLEAKTWCGTNAAGDLKEGTANPATQVGFDLPGPSILLGNAQDNPLIKHLADSKVLPYTPTADFPGRGHGMLAWNLMTLGHDLETVALIANDADGINEAVGTLVEIGIGIDPLTPLVLPTSNTVTAATQSGKAPTAVTQWQANLSDRVASLAVGADGNITAYSANGAMTAMDAKGIMTALTIVDKAPAADKPSVDVAALPKDKLAADLKVKQVVAANGLTAVAYYGGRLQVFDAAGAVKAEQQLPQDITAIAWDANTLVTALADGTVLGLGVK